MLPSRTLPCIMGNSSALEQLFTICVYTLPPRFNNPKTGIFPLAQRPRKPRTLLAPKYDSSISVSSLDISNDS